MANNILYVSDGDYGKRTGYIAAMVQGQSGQVVPLEIRDLSNNVVNLTGYTTITGRMDDRRGNVTSIDGTLALDATPSTAPQVNWTITATDTGTPGVFDIILVLSNGSATLKTIPVALAIYGDPAATVVPSAPMVAVTQAQATLLAAVAVLTGLVEMTAGSATGVAIQTFMRTFLASATAIAARINLLPSYTGNAAKVLAVNATADDVEWVAQSGGGGAVDSVFGRTGAVVAASGDYGTNEITDDSVYAKASLTAALDSIANDFTGLDGNLSTHTGNTSNPHSVTAAQAGALATANNLSELTATQATARANIGAGTGNGDVTGPASSTDNAIVRFDSTTGKLLQNSTATIDDNGNLDIPGFSAQSSREIRLNSSTPDARARISVSSNVLNIVGVSGVSVATYSSNTEMTRVTTTGLGVGTTAPQGRVHSYQTGGGFMHVYKSAITTAQTVIANGTGDVTLVLSGTFTVSDGAGNVAGGVITATVPGANFNLYDDGGTNTCQLQVAADGSVTVIRTAGSRTYAVNLQLNWM